MLRIFLNCLSVFVIEDNKLLRLKIVIRDLDLTIRSNPHF